VLSPRRVGCCALVIARGKLKKRDIEVDIMDGNKGINGRAVITELFS
jgi:hypothetical protein